MYTLLFWILLIYSCFSSYSGDCCTPKFRLFVKDINNIVVEKMFDFTDGNIFSTIVPEIKQNVSITYVHIYLHFLSKIAQIGVNTNRINIIMSLKLTIVLSFIISHFAPVIRHHLCIWFYHHSVVSFRLCSSEKFKFVVFNSTSSNISVISWRSVLLVEETLENHRPVTSHWQTFSHNVVSSTPRHERGSNSQP